MLGVWIAPVGAQVMMTFFDLDGMAGCALSESGWAAGRRAPGCPRVYQVITFCQPAGPAANEVSPGVGLSRLQQAVMPQQRLNRGRPAPKRSKRIHCGP